MCHLRKMSHFGYVKNVSLRVCLLHLFLSTINLSLYSSMYCSRKSAYQSPGSMILHSIFLYSFLCVSKYNVFLYSYLYFVSFTLISNNLKKLFWARILDLSGCKYLFVSIFLQCAHKQLLWKEDILTAERHLRQLFPVP